MQLLKERSWFDVPLIYANQHSAAIVIEKGAPGERAFKDAFADWGEDYPTASSPGSGPVAAVAHTGWIVQVGVFESVGEAQQRIETARSSARRLLAKADPFTEPVVAQDNRKLFRARFAGLDRDQAEAVCLTLKRADISCITVRN